jgi:hypothetical protein
VSDGCAKWKDFSGGRVAGDGEHGVDGARVVQVDGVYLTCGWIGWRMADGADGLIIVVVIIIILKHHHFIHKHYTHIHKK